MCTAAGPVAAVPAASSTGCPERPDGLVSCSAKGSDCSALTLRAYGGPVRERGMHAATRERRDRLHVPCAGHRVSLHGKPLCRTVVRRSVKLMTRQVVL